MLDCPILSVRDIVVFPHVVVPLFVGRSKSVNALEVAMSRDKKIILLTQKSVHNDDPSFNDMYCVGVLGNILQMLKLPDGTMKILVEGIKRVSVLECLNNKEYYSARYEILEPKEIENPLEFEAYRRTITDQFENYAKLNRRISIDTIAAIRNMESANDLIDVIAAHLILRIEDKQALLSETDTVQRFEKLIAVMESEIDVIHVERKIRNRVKKQMEKSQKEYYLNEQIKAIQRELGDSENTVADEIKELEEKAKKLKFSTEAQERFNSELKKLKNMSPMSPEATVVRNYLDWLISIPWKNKTKVKRDIKDAKSILDQDHYGLEKVKERILEFLAVQNRVGKMKGSVLCFMGPPGVGKTSLAKSIARATGRSYVKFSLGGVKDESEIRGHRRTYIGSMPGKIIAGMKKVKSSNPLFLLDEIDKIGADWKGDPASALLEVLDPEQNSAFNDHYLEVDYDLSDVMFITTANTYKMPSPLLDRLEIIRLSGYTEQEKKEIAKIHLIPKQMEENGLKNDEFSITDDAIMTLIRDYTREAGVRTLEREIAKLARKSVKELTENPEISRIDITVDNLEKYAGLEKFKRLGTEDKNLVGVVTGLAWTEVGGELLSIETVSVPGKGKTTLTGKLGDVMQESIQAAMSFVRSRAVSFGIDPKIFESTDFHIHVPEGATPKDGPSAGIAMVTGIVSSLTSIPIKKEVAMTGEITLRGRVLPIGGLKEKLLAAHREGIKTVIIPKENESDLQDIPSCIWENIDIKKVETADDVLVIALSESISERALSLQK
ncbi:MAG: endopeptidase La [Holosporaceae bacterium]|jgi:ATP-dependent Lon protease|nr:endopeptidase La [Holosporaceae bacterium]